MPNLFPELIRSIVDKDRRNGQILLLGSASRELVNKSAESLTGRIGYIELSPFIYPEIDDNKEETMIKHWIRGGFPLSFLAENGVYDIFPFLIYQFIFKCHDIIFEKLIDVFLTHPKPRKQGFSPLYV